ncbi:MAG: hypothetical protein ABW106_09800, partial [Steroidobacteraceae bacterium]
MRKLPSADKNPWTGIRCIAYRLLAIGAALVLAACSDDDSASTYSAYRVTGTVSGLTAAGLVLKNGDADTATVSANASSFQFATRIVPG